MKKITGIVIILSVVLMSCQTDKNQLDVQVFETSASGNQLKEVAVGTEVKTPIEIVIKPEEQFQTITGFGGSFTESSAWLLNQLSKENRDLILKAYFSKEGSNYSLTRTHINSCDFSLSNYSYAPLKDDKELKSFSIDEDRDDIIPMIKEAMDISEEGFKIISSPWTAPPWMKDNDSYVGGKLLPEYYETWAKFFSKYIEEYGKEGIDIWGITVENEPLGNGNNWESMHFTAEEMAAFVQNHLGPQLRKDFPKVKILAYDQNRDHELIEWAETIYGNKEAAKFFDGFAIHWYGSTYDYFPKSLNITHDLAPEKHLINTEACVDAEIPRWRDDAWYWSKEATDWGWDWASEQDKHKHPKYVPVYRYARNIIGSLNNHVDGWVDWNMVLDTQGGPNWFKNWCVAHVIVDPEKDEVYFTPLYYTLAHFSKYIRPNAKRIGFQNPDEKLMVTAVQNPDGKMAVVVLNMESEAKDLKLNLGEKSVQLKISAQALQTILINTEEKYEK
jgi:glucosylceramidase